ncbi:MAG TPA: ribokinase [Alphaproteobacteria bacterium]|nr:ribokinase [Alphaproteobacteria bacterium]
MITVFGSANLDLIGTVHRLPGPGETVPGDTFSTAPGGKGANQALAARRAGAVVRLFAAVGSDGFAREALGALAAGGVDLGSVARVEGAATGIAMILVDQKGENVIAILPGANATMSVTRAEEALQGLGAGDVLMLQQEIPQAATERALDLARTQGVTAILNTAPCLETTPALARKASIVVSNETEFALIAGSDAPLDRLMRAWAEDTGNTIIVTLGADGARAATPERAFAVPAPRIEPVDTVGAGDTFCGYLAAGIDSGLPLEAAMHRAVVAASLACLKPGAQPAIPTAPEVEAALRSGSR